jgi:hypothetical protein
MVPMYHGTTRVFLMHGRDARAYIDALVRSGYLY